MTRPHRAPVAQNGFLGPDNPKSVTSRSVNWRCLIKGVVRQHRVLRRVVRKVLERVLGKGSQKGSDSEKGVFF